MKQTFLFLSVLIFIQCSCVNNSKMDNVENNIDIAKKSFAAFNAHNWEEQANFFSDTCQYLDPSYGDTPIVKSRIEKIGKYRKMEEMSPDIKDEITSIFGVDDKVVVQFISSGTAKTEQGDYKWILPICCVFTFQNGFIVKDETYYNKGK
ncbi:MAG: nuclear transport factor 2 family protein [Bacteroidales bacterium]|nr:nuclear transport factor 2 family protein [Bacteroidales bacterium]MCF8456121.1 nuclear transport factor 2 family protein [Bacteroidales bacterium]